MAFIRFNSFSTRIVSKSPWAFPQICTWNKDSSHQIRIVGTVLQDVMGRYLEIKVRAFFFVVASFQQKTAGRCRQRLASISNSTFLESVNVLFLKEYTSPSFNVNWSQRVTYRDYQVAACDRGSVDTFWDSELNVLSKPLERKEVGSLSSFLTWAQPKTQTEI